MTTAAMEPAASELAQASRMATLEQKLDALATSVESLGEQIQFLSQQAYDSARRQREWDELRADLTPVINDMYSITVEQMEEIQAYVQLEDVLGLSEAPGAQHQELRPIAGPDGEYAGPVAGPVPADY